MEELYKFMYWGDYNKRMEELAEMALLEKWSFAEKNDYSILKNYMKHSFTRLQEEGKVYEDSKYCIFNTGLFTSHYEDIFVLAKLNEHKTVNSDWEFSEFCTEYDLGINEIPERADYFTDPALLVFDWRCPVRIQYKHILEDEANISRLPDIVTSSKKPINYLKGTIDTDIKRVMANYKLAVPQYFNGKIQLLIPLYFEKDNTPELALVLTKMEGGYYQGHTCLTMEMAYNNARLIAKPESNWLLP